MIPSLLRRIITDSRWYVPRLVALVFALGGVTSFMYYSDLTGRALMETLKPEVDPTYTGGPTAGLFYDPLGDDWGFGGLRYPTNRAFLPGSLDLVRYTVHTPVWGARWQSVSEYWQLDLSFASGPADVRAVRVYIDSDGDGEGSAETSPGAPEGVALDPGHPWDWCIALDGPAGTIRSSDGTLRLPVDVTVHDGGKTMRVRIPLAERSLQRLYTAERTWQYVLVAPLAQWSRGGIMPVAERPSGDRAGGAVSPFVPAVFDLLAEEAGAQKYDLASWNETALSLATVHPVEIPLAPAEDGITAGRVSAERIAELKALALEEETRIRETAAAAYSTALEASATGPTVNDFEFAVAAFEAGENKKAETAFDDLLNRNPDDALSLAFKGALTAQKAAEAPALAAVAIVERAFKDLDQAVALAKAPDEILGTRLCRGNVSLAIPETVFGKRLQGAADFLAAAAVLRESGMAGGEGQLLDCYIKAARCLCDASREEEAGTWFREAFLIANRTAPEAVSASCRLELALRGFDR